MKLHKKQHINIINNVMSQQTTDSVVPDSWTAATNLNSDIRTYADLAQRVKVRLGFPDFDVTSIISDEAIASNINESLEVFTRYAGYDVEYLIFKDEVLGDGCEVKLDDLVDACSYCDVTNPTLSCDNVTEELVLTSVDVTESLIGESVSLLNRSVITTKTEGIAVNVDGSETQATDMLVKFDPDSPWDFDVSRSTRVEVEPLSAYPDTEYLHGTTLIDAWVKIDTDSNVAEVYPVNWEQHKVEGEDCLDPNITLCEWWDICADVTEGWDPSNATHVEVSSVPFGTVGGVQPLEINTGWGVTFLVCDGVTTNGEYINAKIKFTIDHRLPPSHEGSYNVISSTGFGVKLDNWWCLPNTPSDVGINARFYETLSSEEYGLSAIVHGGFKDPSMRGEQRKVVDVFTVDDTGTNEGDLLFNFEFAFAQGIFGYDGMGNRFRSSGYDLVTYDISRQYIENINRMFGHSNISFNFNKRSQMLRVNKGSFIPNSSRVAYLLGLYLERPISEMIGEMWVRDYTTALTKIMIGNILTQFAGADSVSGVTINGTDALSQGLAEKEELLNHIRNENSEGGLSTPFYME